MLEIDESFLQKPDCGEDCQAGLTVDRQEILIHDQRGWKRLDSILATKTRCKAAAKNKSLKAIRN